MEEPKSNVYTVEPQFQQQFQQHAPSYYTTTNSTYIHSSANQCNNDTIYLSGPNTTTTIKRRKKNNDGFWYKHGHTASFIVTFIVVIISGILSVVLSKAKTPLVFALLAIPIFAFSILLISAIFFCCNKRVYGAATFLFFWTIIVISYLFGSIALLAHAGNQYDNKTLDLMERRSSALIGSFFMICAVVYCFATWPMLNVYRRERESYHFWSCNNPCMLGLMIVAFSALILLILAAAAEGGNSGSGNCGSGGCGGSGRRRQDEDGNAIVDGSDGCC